MQQASCLTVQLFHGRIELVFRMCVEETLDCSSGYSMTTQLVSLLQHLLDVVLNKMSCYTRLK